ncbi:MAG: N-acetylmuramoyl-L-alanine amidase [Pseudomonadota bacterium]
MVVLHYTAMDTAEAALDRLCDPKHEVSAHYLISENGRLWQMVREGDRAWHAGRGSWGQVTDVNSHSIGIELANTGTHSYPEPQMKALEHLLAEILARWSIPAARVIGHQDMAPDRKTDPGRRFDWRRLAILGLAVWPDCDPSPEAEGSSFEGPTDVWLDPLRAIGFTADATPDQLLAAFRARFRPHASGPCRDADVQMIQHAANDFPVDVTVRIA